MASESGDNNMDREMILADFQVCVSPARPQILLSVVSNLSAVVELTQATVNSSTHDLSGVVNSRAVFSS